MSVGKKKKDTLLPLPFTLKERTYTDFRRNEPSFVMVKKKKREGENALFLLHEYQPYIYCFSPDLVCFSPFLIFSA